MHQVGRKNTLDTMNRRPLGSQETKYKWILEKTHKTFYAIIVTTSNLCEATNMIYHLGLPKHRVSIENCFHVNALNRAISILSKFLYFVCCIDIFICT